MNYEKLCQIVKKYKTDTEDLLQDSAIYILENNIPEENYEDAVRKCNGKLWHERFVEKYAIAPHIYNDDGEEMDDDLYFVDKSTIEFNEGKQLSDNLIYEGKKLVSCMMNINKLLDVVVKFDCNTPNKFKRYNNLVNRDAITGWGIEYWKHRSKHLLSRHAEQKRMVARIHEMRKRNEIYR